MPKNSSEILLGPAQYQLVQYFYSPILYITITALSFTVLLQYYSTISTLYYTVLFQPYVIQYYSSPILYSAIPAL